MKNLILSYRSTANDMAFWAVPGPAGLNPCYAESNAVSDQVEAGIYVGRRMYMGNFFQLPLKPL